MANFNGTVDQIESTANKSQEIIYGEDGEKLYPSTNAVVDYVDNVVKEVKETSVPRQEGGPPWSQVYIEKGGNEGVGLYPLDDNAGWREEEGWIGVGKYIPVRNSRGNLETDTPIDDIEVANKKYVDDNAVPIKYNGAPSPAVYAQDSNTDGAEGVTTILTDISSSAGDDENHPFMDNADCIPVRNDNGSIVVGTPQRDYEAANKKYVDDTAKGKLDIIDNSKGQTASGMLAPGFYATDKVGGKIINVLLRGSWNTTGNTVPMRDSNGRMKVASPAALNDAANKEYVDNSVAAVEGPKVIHTWSANSDAFYLEPSRMYIALSGTDDSRVSVRDKDGNIMTDHAGNELSTFRIGAFIVPKDMVTYNDSKGWMILFIHYSSLLELGFAKIFIPADTAEDGSYTFPKIYFADSGVGHTVWELGK